MKVLNHVHQRKPKQINSKLQIISILPIYILLDGFDRLSWLPSYVHTTKSCVISVLRSHIGTQGKDPCLQAFICSSHFSSLEYRHISTYEASMKLARQSSKREQSHGIKLIFSFPVWRAIVLPEAQLNTSPEVLVLARKIPKALKNMQGC